MENINNLFIKSLASKQEKGARAIFTTKNNNNIYISAEYPASFISNIINDYTKGGALVYVKTIENVAKFTHILKNFVISCDNIQQQAEILQDLK